jgi:hypothetical protein
VVCFLLLFERRKWQETKKEVTKNQFPSKNNPQSSILQASSLHQTHGLRIKCRIYGIITLLPKFLHLSVLFFRKSKPIFDPKEKEKKSHAQNHLFIFIFGVTSFQYVIFIEVLQKDLRKGKGINHRSQNERGEEIKDEAKCN